MSERWSKTMMVLHWASAALVVGLLAAGFFMEDLAPDAPARRLLGRLHSLGGLTLGVLTVVRLVVRLRGPRPAPLPLPNVHRLGIGAVHALLYLGLFLLVASGVELALGTTWREYLAGAQPLPPDFTGVRPRQAHGLVAPAVALLTLAHVAGVALQHVRAGGVLQRMSPFSR